MTNNLVSHEHRLLQFKYRKHAILWFSYPHTDKKQKQIREMISCNTKSVIYLLTCACGMAYVGKQTNRQIAEHERLIRYKKGIYPVAEHFMEMNHPVTSLTYQIETFVCQTKGWIRRNYANNYDIS